MVPLSGVSSESGPGVSGLNSDDSRPGPAVHPEGGLVYRELHKTLFPSAAPESSFPPAENLLPSLQLTLFKPQCLPEAQTYIFYEPVRTLKEVGPKVAWVTQEERQEDSCQGDQDSGRGPKPWLACTGMGKDLNVQTSPNSSSVKPAGLPPRLWVCGERKKT